MAIVFYKTVNNQKHTIMKTTNFNPAYLDNSIDGLMSLNSNMELLDLNDDKSKLAFIEDANEEYEYLFVA